MFLGAKIIVACTGQTGADRKKDPVFGAVCCKILSNKLCVISTKNRYNFAFQKSTEMNISKMIFFLVFHGTKLALDLHLSLAILSVENHFFNRLRSRLPFLRQHFDDAIKSWQNFSFVSFCFATESCCYKTVHLISLKLLKCC